MKAKIFLATIIMLSLPFWTIAQTTMDDEITLIQSAFGMEKRAIIEEYMGLGLPEAQAFWPIYQRYEDERRAIARERMKIIADYAENFDNLDDSILDDLAKRRLKNDANRTKLHSKYYKTFKKATSASIAAKFLQIDDYIHSTILLAMLDNLPFIGEK